MQRALLALTILVAVTGSASADVIATQLKALHDAAQCDTKAPPWRPWCIAARFAEGKVADLPKGKVLIGLTIELQVGHDAKQALTDKVGLAALSIDAKGNAKLTDVTPSNADEQKAIAEAVASVAMVLKGKATSAKLPAELAAYVKTIEGKYPTTKTATEWTWPGANPSHLRKVGEVWVVVEAPAKNDGIWASVFTESWE